MNKLTTWFHTRTFLSDMLVRYSAHNNILEDENERLRKKLGQKDKELERAQADHRQSNSFNRTVITNMQKRIDELTQQVKDLEYMDTHPDSEQHDYIDAWAKVK